MRAELRQAAEEEPTLPGIIQDIVDTLSVFRDPGSNHFLRYITNEDIGKEFREGRISRVTSIHSPLVQYIPGDYHKV